MTMTELIEIRTYQLKSGTGPQFHALMHTQSLPLLRAAGIDVVSAQMCAKDANAYMLIRAFASLEHLTQSQDVFYASAAWQDGPRSEILACIEHYQSVVLAVAPSTIAGLRRQSHSHQQQ